MIMTMMTLTWVYIIYDLFAYWHMYIVHFMIDDCMVHRSTGYIISIA